MTINMCCVCRSEPAATVCQLCRAALRRTLANLPARYGRLTAALVPSTGGEKMSAPARPEAPLPVGLAALSLLGPGSGAVDVPLHPLVRHWSVRRRVAVQVHLPGRVIDVERTIDDWFHEAVVDADGNPVMVPDGDQVGTVPPREWLAATARAWRQRFGHHEPPPGRARPGGEADRWVQVLSVAGQRPPPPTAAGRSAAVGPLLRAGTAPAVIVMLLLPALAGAAAREAHFGIGGYQLPSARPVDPLLEDIERRFGEPAPVTGMHANVRYLLTWLDKACDTDPGIADFAAELTALDAEISRVLGETPDRTWLGRCPAFITEPATEEGQPARSRPCGAALWQDNTGFTAQTRCPRCHTAWDTRGPSAAHTAALIRRVWPVDRRRRYNAVEISRLRALRCPACAGRVKIEWRDVTGTRDAVRWWQPVTGWCDTGCDDARRVL